MFNHLYQAGDPLSHDFIVLFGNDDNKHWYAVLIDNRVGIKKTVYLDSGEYNKQQMTARCNDVHSIINDFREYLRVVLINVLNIPANKISRRSHPIEDGRSRRQTNRFDCGPYALINCQLYTSKTDHRHVTPETLPLIRAWLLYQLYLYKTEDSV